MSNTTEMYAPHEDDGFNHMLATMSGAPVITTQFTEDIYVLFDIPLSKTIRAMTTEDQEVLLNHYKKLLTKPGFWSVGGGTGDLTNLQWFRL